MKKTAVISTLPVLLLAACGQPTPPTPQAASSASTPQTEMPADRDLKTIAQLLQEPGWEQTSPGFWERTTAEGRETIYSGALGAERALKDREATLARIKRDLVGREGGAAIIQKMEASVDTLKQDIERARENGRLNPQSVWQCTVQASTQRTTDGPGVKATGYVSCPTSGYHPSGQAVAYTSYDPGGWDEKTGSTYVSVFAKAYGSVGCFAHVNVDASDGWTGEVNGVTRERNYC